MTCDVKMNGNVAKDLVLKAEIKNRFNKKLRFPFALKGTLCQYSSSINKAGLEDKHPNLLCTHLQQAEHGGGWQLPVERDRSALQGCPDCAPSPGSAWLGGLGCVNSLPVQSGTRCLQNIGYYTRFLSCLQKPGV